MSLAIVYFGVGVAIFTWFTINPVAFNSVRRSVALRFGLVSHRGSAHDGETIIPVSRASSKVGWVRIMRSWSSLVMTD
jgi:hypothetical protein